MLVQRQCKYLHISTVPLILSRIQPPLSTLIISCHDSSIFNLLLVARLEKEKSYNEILTDFWWEYTNYYRYLCWLVYLPALMMLHVLRKRSGKIRLCGCMFSYFFETSCKVAYRLLVAVFSLRRLQHQYKPVVIHADVCGSVCWKKRIGLMTFTHIWCKAPDTCSRNRLQKSVP